MVEDNTNSTLREVYARLFEAFGPQHWWPADTAEKVVIGAVLTQNTAWRNVERAIEALQRRRCASLARIHKLTTEALADIIRPAGTYRVKARRLKAVAAAHHRYGGSLDRLLQGELSDVRRRLLSIHGIGPETADAILLYAGDRPSFVVDAYTNRVLRRHGLIKASASYDEVQALFHAALPAESALFNEYHALLVELGKRHCRPNAQCDACPLHDLPHDESL